jgi:hypothetical protein
MLNSLERNLVDRAVLPTPLDPITEMVTFDFFILRLVQKKIISFIINSIILESILLKLNKKHFGVSSNRI